VSALRNTQVNSSEPRGRTDERKTQQSEEEEEELQRSRRGGIHLTVLMPSADNMHS